jgi:TPR repeat protein
VPVTQLPGSNVKTLVFCLALLCAGSCSADELSDANAAFANKDYAGALQKYTKLANAGNVEAQQHLGEMYWYGEAGSVDEARAETWFRKAAAKGNPVASASLALMARRVERRKDIDYWMSGYDGSELSSGQYRCAAPRFPSVSKQNEEIDRVWARMKAWQDCHNGLAKALNDASPATKLIPADIAKMMTKPEMEQAEKHLTEVIGNITQSAQVQSKLVLADFAVWRDATDAWIKEHNDIVKRTPTPEREHELEERRNNRAN